jgi:hypothetical protein
LRLEFDGAYTYYPTYAQVLKEYNRPSFKPVFMEEANYEFEHNANTDDDSTANLAVGVAPNIEGKNFGVRSSELVSIAAVANLIVELISGSKEILFGAEPDRGHDRVSNIEPAARYLAGSRELRYTRVLKPRSTGTAGIIVNSRLFSPLSRTTVCVIRSAVRGGSARSLRRRDLLTCRNGTSAHPARRCLGTRPLPAAAALHQRSDRHRVTPYAKAVTAERPMRVPEIPQSE